jgi:hypothetical protein
MEKIGTAFTGVLAVLLALGIIYVSSVCMPTSHLKPMTATIVFQVP